MNPFALLVLHGVDHLDRHFADGQKGLEALWLLEVEDVDESGKKFAGAAAAVLVDCRLHRGEQARKASETVLGVANT